MYCVGAVVLYKGAFGAGAEEKVKIEGTGEKDGKLVYDLDNGKWCWPHQIIKQVGFSFDPLTDLKK